MALFDQLKNSDGLPAAISRFIDYLQGHQPMTRPKDHESHEEARPDGQTVQGMDQLRNLRGSLPSVARECQALRTAEAIHLPDLEIKDGLYVGLENRGAPHPNASPYGRRAMQHVVAIARSVEDIAFRALDGEDPPKARLVECRLKMMGLIQACLRCEPKTEGGEPINCAALEALSTLDDETAPQGTTSGSSPSEDGQNAEG